MLRVMNTSRETILVLGLGNTLLSDEAVGVRVVDALTNAPESGELGLRLLDGGTMGMSLLVEMEDADALIIIDAAFLQESPGFLKVFEGQDMDHFLRHRGRSPHDIGLDDLMDGLRLREAVPERRALVAIQPEILTVGENLTESVAASVPKAVQTVVNLARRWTA